MKKYELNSKKLFRNKRENVSTYFPMVLFITVEGISKIGISKKCIQGNDVIKGN